MLLVKPLVARYEAKKEQGTAHELLEKPSNELEDVHVIKFDN